MHGQFCDHFPRIACYQQYPSRPLLMMPRSLAESSRRAWDGNYYTRTQFHAYYGRELGEEHWQSAQDESTQSNGSTGDRAIEAPQPRSAEQPVAPSAANAVQPPSEPTLAIVLYTPLLMNLEQLLAVKAELNATRRGNARKFARAALNRCADDPEERIVDMTGEPWWQDYIASQDCAEHMATVGITSFYAAPIKGVPDPNRANRTRVDFIVTLANDSYWRLHPGKRKINDAVPKQMTAVVEGFAPSDQYIAPGPGGVLTPQRASEIQANDRMGKRTAWLKLQEMEAAGSFDDEGWLDISDLTRFQWWRWVANIAKHRVDSGVSSARVRKINGNSFEFQFSGRHAQFTIMLWKNGNTLNFSVD